MHPSLLAEEQNLFYCYTVTSALSHLRVCDLGGQLAGAGATKILAAFGAEVIRVEDPVTRGMWDALRGVGPFALLGLIGGRSGKRYETTIMV